MLDDDTYALATGKNHAVLVTILPDGHPQAHVMWVDAEADHILINTELHRRKYQNVSSDPRVTVTIIDADDPQHYAEVRGKVVKVVRGREARQHVDTLSQKYTGELFTSPIKSERVLLKIAPEHIWNH
jgi:PPOX class probable F420-dependent enzyme